MKRGTGGGAGQRRAPVDAVPGDADAVGRRGPGQDQEALLDGIAEVLFAEMDVDSLPWEAPWPELAAQYCHSLRGVLLQHPNAVSVFATRPVRSSASIDMGVRAMAKLHDAGLPPAAALRILRCLREF